MCISLMCLRVLQLEQRITKDASRAEICDRACLAWRDARVWWPKSLTCAAVSACIRIAGAPSNGCCWSHARAMLGASWLACPHGHDWFKLLGLWLKMDKTAHVSSMHSAIGYFKCELKLRPRQLAGAALASVAEGNDLPVLVHLVEGLEEPQTLKASCNWSTAILTCRVLRLAHAKNHVKWSCIAGEICCRILPLDLCTDGGRMMLRPESTCHPAQNEISLNDGQSWLSRA